MNQASDAIPRPRRPARSWPQPLRPRVVGVAGGAGVTTLAAALGGQDCGVFPGSAGVGGVDVLVCHGTRDMIHRASTAVDQLLRAERHRPVVAVVLGQRAPDRVAHERLRLIAPYAARIVFVPQVKRWARADAPLDEARALPGIPDGALPRHLHAFAGAVSDIREALAHRQPVSRSARPAPGRAVSPRRASRPTPQRSR